MAQATFSLKTEGFNEFFNKYADKMPEVIKNVVQLAGLDGESNIKQYLKSYNTDLNLGRNYKAHTADAFEWYVAGKKAGKRKKEILDIRIKNRRIGRLASSIFGQWEGMKFIIGSRGEVKYAPSIIDDTEPYTVHPKNGKSIIFVNYDRQLTFAKKVVHPGGIKLTGEGTDHALLYRAARKIEGMVDGKYFPNVMKMMGLI